MENETSFRSNSAILEPPLKDQIDNAIQALTAVQQRYAHAASRDIHDPYIILLVNPHSHKFKDELLAKSTNGGSEAAKKLRAAVQQHTAEMMPDPISYRIVVRVYANLKILSGGIEEKGIRALAGFAAGFSREDSFFDFVDVGNEDIAKAKIRDNLVVCMRDVQCQRVFLAAEQDKKLESILLKLSSFHSKVKCVHSGNSLDTTPSLRLQKMRVDFNQVFGAEQGLTKIPANVLASGLCLDFQKGKCLWKNCKFRHRLIGALCSNTAATSLTEPTMRTESGLASLPTDLGQGTIPLNAANQRLDFFIAPPSKEQWAIYTARVGRKGQKLCNAFHIQTNCSSNPCEYDHGPIDGDVRKCLGDIVKTIPCKYRGACRQSDCIAAHVCQKAICKSGKAKDCRIARELHGIDLKVEKWVRPADVQRGAFDFSGEGVNDATQTGVDVDAWLMKVGDSTDEEEVEDVVEPCSLTVDDLIDL